MGQNISETGKLTPWNGRFVKFKLLRKIFDCLTDDLKLPNDCILSFSVIIEGCLIETENVISDSVAGLDDILQALVSVT